ALRGCAIDLAAGPKIAAGEAAEHGRAASVRPFALESEKYFLDRVAHTPDSGKRIYSSRLPFWVTRSRNPEISPFKKSTSAGNTPPAEAWPVTVLGLMVETRTSRIYRAASRGSHSGLSRSLVPTMISVFALIVRSALTRSPFMPGVVP